MRFFKLWARLRIAKRKLRIVRDKLNGIESGHAKELSELRAHYERLLSQEKVKVENTILSCHDSLLQFNKLFAVSHTILDTGRAETEPAFKKPEQPIEDTLSGEQLNFFLDYRENFFEGEAELGKTDEEIKHLWDTEHKHYALEQTYRQIG